MGGTTRRRHDTAAKQSIGIEPDLVPVDRGNAPPQQQQLAVRKLHQLLWEQKGTPLVGHGLGAVCQDAVDRQRLRDRFLPHIADALRQLIGDAQLFGRERDLDAAVGDDLVRGHARHNTARSCDRD